jgi:SAM-dependent methyltransferase
MKSYADLITEAEQAAFSGWDFSWLEGRLISQPTPWDYPARQYMHGITSLLDMGTGGGEFLSSLAPLPPETVATEAYPPNQAVARQRLTPLGITVVDVSDDIAIPMPFQDQRFDLVINRHASYNPGEVLRILKPGCHFLTQQVGGKNSFEINQAFQAKPEFIYSYWTLDYAVSELIEAGFQILDGREVLLEERFMDIGALVYHLKVISWQVPEFTVKTHANQLRHIHDEIQRNGFWLAHSHRFIIDALRPG